MKATTMQARRTVLKATGAAFLTGAVLTPLRALAGTSDPAGQVEAQSRSALKALTSRNSAARAINSQALAVLVFPKVTRVGLILGGQHGEGALLKSGKASAFYSTAGVSAGLQAGAQNYGYALFFMNDTALSQLDKADGWEVGVGPTVVVVDEGFGKNLTTTTMKDDIYAFVFSQKGLMAGVGVQGNKISRIDSR